MLTLSVMAKPEVKMDTLEIFRKNPISKNFVYVDSI